MKTITLTQAVQHATGRQIDQERRNEDTAFLVFGDGTAIGCQSQYEKPPEYTLYEPREVKKLAKTFWQLPEGN